MQIKIKTATFCKLTLTFGKKQKSQPEKYVNVGCFAGHGQIPFFSPRNITGQSTFWFGRLPIFWSKGKYNKNLDDELMDCLICQDVSLLSDFNKKKKVQDASNRFIKSSRALQSCEVITDLQEREGEESCSATSGKEQMGKRIRSEAQSETGKLQCTDSWYHQLFLGSHALPELTMLLNCSHLAGDEVWSVKTGQGSLTLNT